VRGRDENNKKNISIRHSGFGRFFFFMIIYVFFLSGVEGASTEDRKRLQCNLLYIYLHFCRCVFDGITANVSELNTERRVNIKFLTKLNKTAAGILSNAK